MYNRIVWLEMLFNKAKDKIDELEKELKELREDKDGLLYKVETLFRRNTILLKHNRILRSENKILKNENEALKKVLWEYHEKGVIIPRESEKLDNDYTATGGVIIDEPHPYDEFIGDLEEKEELKISVDKEIKEEGSRGLRNLISETLKRNLKAQKIDKYV